MITQIKKPASLVHTGRNNIVLKRCLHAILFNEGAHAIAIARGVGCAVIYAIPSAGQQRKVVVPA